MGAVRVWQGHVLSATELADVDGATVQVCRIIRFPILFPTQCFDWFSSSEIG
jgi:hypothetical protein